MFARKHLLSSGIRGKRPQSAHLRQTSGGMLRRAPTARNVRLFDDQRERRGVGQGRSTRRVFAGHRQHIGSRRRSRTPASSATAVSTSTGWYQQGRCHYQQQENPPMHS
jgi:hypothetical protein